MSLIDTDAYRFLVAVSALADAGQEALDACPAGHVMEATVRELAEACAMAGAWAHQKAAEMAAVDPDELRRALDDDPGGAGG
ncbi:MAG: hypothetical protein RJQ03_03985 [Miltoncostaeaceae bacterium]